tara:strand:- start:2567 stop:3502 length:936 start_codon:yes stop_codon:yes gene_type:complete
MKTAILLLGFNRVDYFQQTLSALEANKAAHDCDLHVYLDGGENARQLELVELVNSSTFENPTFVLREENWGIGRHLIDARRTLFDSLSYDRVILLEDDMLLAPSYVQTVLNLLDWSQQFCDIGTVMAYNINHDSAESQAGQMEHVVATNRHFWGYAMTREVWDIIKHIVYDFERKYLSKNTYRDRSHFRIRWMFMRSIMSKKRKQRFGEHLIPPDCLTPPFPRIPRKSPTSQDAITALALWHHGFGRITTRVSRAEYIGVEGFSFSPKLFADFGFENQNTQDLSQFTDAVKEYEFAARDEHGNTLKPRPYE